MQPVRNNAHEKLWLLKQILNKLTFAGSGLWDYTRALLIRDRNLELTSTSRLSRDRHYFRDVMSKWYPHDRNLKPEMQHGPFRSFTFPTQTYAKKCTDGEGKIVPWTGFKGEGPPVWVWDGYR